jgi:MbtH protein
MNEDRVDEARFTVVRNHEEQYSIWPFGKALPAGWEDVGTSGSKQACLEYIERTWTDMRPLSLRRKMDTQVG